jgi:hypothetical protein
MIQEHERKDHTLPPVHANSILRDSKEARTRRRQVVPNSPSDQQVLRGTVGYVLDCHAVRTGFDSRHVPALFHERFFRELLGRSRLAHSILCRIGIKRRSGPNGNLVKRVILLNLFNAGPALNDRVGCSLVKRDNKPSQFNADPAKNGRVDPHKHLENKTKHVNHFNAGPALN